MSSAKKIPRSQRQKANKKMAKRERKIDKTTFFIYGLGFVAIAASYYLLLRDWDTANFVLTVIVSCVWLFMFTKYVIKQK